MAKMLFAVSRRLRVSEAVLSADDRARVREILQWYKEHHPMWFDWLHVVPRGG